MIGTLFHRMKASPQIRESAGVFAARVLGLGLSVTTNFLLARGLGPEDYGRYGYALSILSILLLFAQMGLPVVLLREVSKALEENVWSEVKALRRFAFLWGFAVGGFLLGLFHGVMVANWVSDPGGRWGMIRTMAPYLILASWNSIQAVTLQGLRRIVLGNFPVFELFYTVILFGLFWRGGGHLGMQEAVGAFLFSLVSGVMLFQFLLNQVLPEDYRGAPLSPHLRIRAWLTSAFSIFLAESLFILNGQVDVIMLGVFRSNEEIGFYRLAVRLAEFVAFPFVVANASIVPRIAGYFVRGEMEELGRWIRKLTRIAFVASLLIWLGFALTGRWILGLAGEAYRAGYPALLLLGLAQLVKVGAGPVGWVLQMTHNEKTAAMGVHIAFIVNVLLNALLTPWMGFVGTALATALSLLSLNLILTAFVWKRLHMRVGVF